MKKIYLMIITIVFGFFIHANALAECPKDCDSCWEQCSKNDDCGSGHKCISTACGNRCVKE